MHGASVHFVTSELDGGPVIAQVEIPVRADDTAATLAHRLLPLEHRLLVASVGEIASGRIVLDGDRVLRDSRPLGAPLRLGDDGALVAAA
jgi:phosphoribosylglycinamide formyltransferase-1